MNAKPRSKPDASGSPASQLVPMLQPDDPPPHTDQRFSVRWDAFWFAPVWGPQLTHVRIATGVLAAIWFTLLFSSSAWWFGEQGWAATEFSRKLSVASEGMWSSRLRVSPLWSTSNPVVVKVWASAGVLLSLLSIAGLGGRVIMFALFLSVLFMAQRYAWTAGAFEPYLIAVLGYLIIAPGRCLWCKRSPEYAIDSCGGLALRLIQVHTWMLLSAGQASQLALESWWRGEAVWWLAATGHSNALSLDQLRGHLLFVNLLTHGITLCTIAAVLALWPKRSRRYGLVCGCIVAMAYALVADQMLYGGLLLAGLLSFLPAGRLHSRSGSHL